MSSPSSTSSSPAGPSPGPLAAPEAWNLVSGGYTSDLAPVFEHFATAALDAVPISKGHIVDVATGPGTLALLAARRGLRVSALDFAEDMLGQLRERVAQAGLEGIEATQGNGMELPYADATFDAGFSMFGLIFFPDRARGFAELRRVLRSGAWAAVASWPPMERVPVIADVFAAIRRALPNLPFGDGKAPLGEPSDFVAEMRAAGFEDAHVRNVTHAISAPDLASYWASTLRSNAPLVLLRNRLGPQAWNTLNETVFSELLAKYGPGPLEIRMTANLGLGRVP